MRTTIVELLKNKLDLDQPQHLDQFKKIKLQDTNIECTEVYPGHFAILRGAVWKIDSKVRKVIQPSQFDSQIIGFLYYENKHQQ